MTSHTVHATTDPAARDYGCPDLDCGGCACHLSAPCTHCVEHCDENGNTLTLEGIEVRAELATIRATLTKANTELARVREQRDRALDLAEALLEDLAGHECVTAAEHREQLDRLRRAAAGL